MGIEELHQVTPGQTLGDIRVQLADGTSRGLCTLKEGIIPEDSHLAKEGATAFFALDPQNGTGQLVAAIEQHESESEAIIAIVFEPLAEEARRNIPLLQGIAEIALTQSNVPKEFDAVLDPACAESLDKNVIAKIGFVATESGSLIFQKWHRQPSTEQAVAA